MWALMMVVWMSLVCCSLEEIKISFDEMEDDPRRRLKSSLLFTNFCTVLFSVFRLLRDKTAESCVESEAGLWSSLPNKLLFY